MVKNIIEINISYKELKEREERCLSQRNFNKPDRVPVVPLVDTWYWLPKIDKTYKEFFSSAKNMLECQLLGHKWFYENIKSDHYGFVINPVFAYVSEAGTFGAEVEFRENDIPWVKKHPIQNEDDLIKFENTDPIYSGLHGKEIKLREEMIKIAGDYKIRFNDGIEIGIEDSIGIGYNNFSYTSGIFGIGVAGRTIGPMLLANDLRGPSNMYMDVLSNPDFAKRILDIATYKIIKWVEFTKEIMGEPKEGVFVGDDGAAQLSPDLYRKFLLPCHKKMKNYFGGYTVLHADAKADHILAIFADELGIDEFAGFSYLDEKELVEKLFSGKTVLCGNINPMNIESGSKESIMQECKKAIEYFAPYSGFFLMDGNNIPPGTPVESINYLYEAAKEYGRY